MTEEASPGSSAVNHIYATRSIVPLLIILFVSTWGGLAPAEAGDSAVAFFTEHKVVYVQHEPAATQ